MTRAGIAAACVLLTGALSLLIAATTGGANERQSLVPETDGPPRVIVTPPATGDVNLTPQMERLKREQRRLSAEVDELRTKLDSVASSIDIAREPALTLDERIEVERELESRRYEYLDVVVETENEDPVWAAEQETKMEVGFVTTLGSGSVLESLDCRSTICRAEMSHVDADAQEQAYGSLPRAEGWDTRGSIHQVNEGDELRTTFYVMRSGHQVPRLEE